MTAGLQLTALAADAVVELAALRNVQPEEVLQSLTEGRPDTMNHRREHPQLAVRVIYPATMDEYDWAMTEAKGWIEVTVRSPEGVKGITFHLGTRGPFRRRRASRRHPRPRSREPVGRRSRRSREPADR